MVFLWVSDFYPKYCKPGCKDFFIQFVKAWIESLVYQHTLEDNDFTEREAVIKLWQSSLFDLYHFSKRDKRKMESRIKYLRAQIKAMDDKTQEDIPDQEHAPSLLDFIEAMRSSGNEVFEKHGAILVYQWVLQRDEKAKEEQDKVDLLQAKMDLENAQKEAERIELSLSEDDEMGDEFDSYPNRCHTPLRNIDWKEGTFASLLISIDPTLPHPSKVSYKDRPAADESAFFISREEIFDGIFGVGHSVEDDGRGGKVVLITGGAKGIGRMISEGFVQNGATVYVSSRDAKACEQACKELNALGKGKADYIAADLYREDAAQNIADELRKRAGKLDVLVNNSGSNWGESYDTYPSAAWDRVLNLNLKRVFQLTQAVTPLLEAASSSTSPARIINIGSVDGLRVPALETFAYSASKAGLHHLSRVLASHLGKRGITSNTIACGPFQSKMMKATLEKFKDVIEGGIPLGRIGSPEDVAGTCIWLSSRAGAYVNGATIALDGGSVVGAKL